MAGLWLRLQWVDQRWYRWQRHRVLQSLHLSKIVVLIGESEASLEIGMFWRCRSKGNRSRYCKLGENGGPNGRLEWNAQKGYRHEEYVDIDVKSTSAVREDAGLRHSLNNTAAFFFFLPNTPLGRTFTVTILAISPQDANWLTYSGGSERGGIGRHAVILQTQSPCCTTIIDGRIFCLLQSSVRSRRSLAFLYAVAAVLPPSMWMDIWYYVELSGLLSGSSQ